MYIVILVVPIQPVLNVKIKQLDIGMKTAIAPVLMVIFKMELI